MGGVDRPIVYMGMGITCIYSPLNNFCVVQILRMEPNKRDDASVNSTLEDLLIDSDGDIEVEDSDGGSYIDTDRLVSTFNISEPPQVSRWSSQMKDVNQMIDEDDNEEEYLAVRKLALYGMILFGVF